MLVVLSVMNNIYIIAINNTQRPLPEWLKITKQNTNKPVRSIVKIRKDNRAVNSVLITGIGLFLIVLIIAFFIIKRKFWGQTPNNQ